jgi:hypothetical protein
VLGSSLAILPNVISVPEYRPIICHRPLRGKATDPATLYTQHVSIKLSVANRYLRNPEMREKTVIRSVTTSSAIEGIRTPFGRDAQTGPTSRGRLKRKKS